MPLAGTGLAPGAGYRLSGMPIPAIPALRGAVLHFQWALGDPGSANGMFTLTEGLTVIVL